MADPFTAANRARKRRTKWWREHIPLAYVVVASAFAVLYVCFAVIDRKLPSWLAALGVSPSGVRLLLGTAYCGVGVWGLRTQRGTGGSGIWALLYSLCLLGGILLVAKAFAFV